MTEVNPSTVRPLRKTETPRTLSELAAAAEDRAGGWLRREVWWRAAHYLLLTVSTVLAAVAGATAIGGVWNGTLAGVLALAASALTAAAAVLRPAVMASACAGKAAKYLALARDVRRADDTAAPGARSRDDYYALLARYDEIRSTPEPALPTGNE